MTTPLFYLFSLQVIFWITTTIGLKTVQPQLEPISDENWGNRDYRKRDEHPFSSLDLKKQEHFLWGSPSIYGSPFANMTMFTSDHELIISMERFSHMLKSVNCGETMKLAFKSNETFQYAIHAWNWTNEEEKNSFVMVANYAGCGEEQTRQPYYVYLVDFDISNLSAYLYANKTTWEEAAHTFHLDFGQIGGSNSPYNSNSTVSQSLNNVTSQPSISPRISKDDNLAGIDLTTNWSKDLFKTTIDGIGIGLSCIECGITGTIDILSHIEYGLKTPTVFTLKAQPKNVGMQMVVKLTAEGTLIGNWIWNDLLLSVPLLGGFNIPGILTFGPNLDINAGFDASALNGTAIIIAGSKATISDQAIAMINVSPLLYGQEGMKVDFSGWGPSITSVPLDINAQVEAEVEAHLQFSLQLSLELFNLGADIAVQFEAPTLQIAARLMYDTNGVCEDKKKQIGVEIDADIGFFVDIKGWDKTGKTTSNTVFEVPLWNNSAAYKISPLCIGFGPNAIESSAVPPPCPFYTETGIDIQANFGKMRRAPPITTIMSGQVDSTHEHILAKRMKIVKDFFNPGVLTCTLPPRNQVKVPTHPGPATVTNVENKAPGRRNANENALLATVKRWYINRQDRQALPSLTRVDTSGLLMGGSNNQRVFVGGGINPKVTVDHVWETHFLTHFIGRQLDPRNFDCQDFQAVFLAQYEGYLILEHLYYNLPSFGFPAYMGTTSDLNEVKG